MMVLYLCTVVVDMWRTKCTFQRSSAPSARHCLTATAKLSCAIGICPKLTRVGRKNMVSCGVSHFFFYTTKMQGGGNAYISSITVNKTRINEFRQSFRSAYEIRTAWWPICTQLLSRTGRSESSSFSLIVHSAEGLYVLLFFKGLRSETRPDDCPSEHYCETLPSDAAGHCCPMGNQAACPVGDELPNSTCDPECLFLQQLLKFSKNSAKIWVYVLVKREKLINLKCVSDAPGEGRLLIQCPYQTHSCIQRYRHGHFPRTMPRKLCCARPCSKVAIILDYVAIILD